MPDDNIKAVLKRAADDLAFMQALMDDREAALKDVPLEPRERKMLLSVPNEQLRRMVERAFVKSLSKTVAGAGCLVAGGLGAMVAFAMTATAGVRTGVPGESVARRTLRAVAEAERQYRVECGCYGALEDLKKRITWPPDIEGSDYEFVITINGDTFAATARHKERPTTRKAFTVGPDGVVKELPKTNEQ